MKNSKITRVLLVLCLATSPLFTHAESSLPMAVEKATGGGGYIIITEDILSLTAGDPNEDIEYIEILDDQNNRVYSTDGCYANDCSVNLSFLSAGSYTAVCDLSSGKSFSGDFDIQ